MRAVGPNVPAAVQIRPFTLTPTPLQVQNNARVSCERVGELLEKAIFPTAPSAELHGRRIQQPSIRLLFQHVRARSY